MLQTLNSTPIKSQTYRPGSSKEKKVGDRGKMGIECFLNMIKRRKIEQDILSHAHTHYYTHRLFLKKWEGGGGGK